MDKKPRLQDHRSDVYCALLEAAKASCAVYYRRSDTGALFPVAAFRELKEALSFPETSQEGSQRVIVGIVGGVVYRLEDGQWSAGVGSTWRPLTVGVSERRVA